MFREMVPWTERFLSLPGFQLDLVDRLFDENGRRTADWFSPRTNVAETPERFEISVELPGLKSEDFHVEVVEGRLEISGEVKQEEETQEKTWHRVERRHGSFRRTLSLPETADADRIEAEYRDGLLKVRIPKKEIQAPETKTIQVKT